MSDRARKLKDDASRLLAKGKLAEAADLYEKIVKADPRDLTARQKLAEMYARLGRVKDAVHAYQSVAGSYAADGLLLKAIAVCKIILQIDPTHTETQTILADLSTKRRGEATAVEMPKAMSAALPAGKRSAADIRGVPSNHLTPKRDVDPSEMRDLRRPITNAPAAPVQPPSLGDVIPLGMGPAQTAQAVAAGQPSVIHEVPLKVPERRAGSDTLGRVVNTSADELQAALAAAAAVLQQQQAAPTVAMLDEASSPTHDIGTGDISIDVSFDSSEGMPAIVGTSSSQEGVVVLDTPASSEGPPQLPDLSEMEELTHDLPPGLPPDELILEDGGDGDGTDVIELTDVARVDVDEIPPIPLFSDLAKDAFIALTERMELRVAAAGDILVQEGERGTSMFVIIQGRVTVKRGGAAEDGGDLTLAELDDGTFFGEMALLSDAPRVASVICIDDTMLFEISRELLADITQQHPSVGEVMKRFHKNRLLTNLLRTSSVFAPFSATDKKSLIEKFKSRSVDEGTYLITRERPGEGLYVLLSGRCEVLDVSAEGQEVLLAELKEGDVFGEMSMLWHKKTCASVKAITPCVVLRLPKEQFNEVIMTHPQILETLTALSEKRQRLNDDLKSPPSEGILNL